MTLTIRLPWPDKRLSPNSSTSWKAKIGPKKKARADGATATYAALPVGARDVRRVMGKLDRIPLTVTFYPPDRRHRDEDNMIASLKSSLDGIADAFSVNDSKFRCRYVIAEPQAPGWVEVRVGDAA